MGVGPASTGRGMPSVPAPPWGERRPEPRQRVVISRERIAEIALQIIDVEGVEAVSMRRIATELGTGAASLYAYVSGKDEILRLTYELILSELDITGITTMTWQDAIRWWSGRMYQIYQRHQDIARLSFADIPSGQESLERVETSLKVLIEGGLPADIAAWLLDRLSLYIGADAFEGWMLTQRFSEPTDDNDSRSPQQRGHEWFAQVGEYFRALPPERFPVITEHAPALMTGDGNARFAFGVELLIAGASAMAGIPLDRPYDRAALLTGDWFPKS